MSSLLFGNGTDIVHWKPSPSTRGTFDILSTCLITMLLCVWTAVHLNVSRPGSFWKPKLRKVGWLVLTLLAPEMVAYTAWYQRQKALSIMRDVNNAYHSPNPLSWREKTLGVMRKAFDWFSILLTKGKQHLPRQPTLEFQKPSSPEDRHPWTMVHGFYAIMGGIAFEIPETESKKFLPSDTKNNAKEFWFISSTSINALLRRKDGRNVLPNLSEEEIKSKSKANGLAKALVCMQALWFIAQCITRLAQRIPISLLELNTFGHAICALLIYFLWWEKPFEVDYPTMIKGQILWDMRAYFWMQHNQSSAVKEFKRSLRTCFEGDGWVQKLSELEKNRLWQYIDNYSEMDIVSNSREQNSPKSPDGDQDNGQRGNCSEQELRHIRDNEDDPTTLAPGQSLQNTAFFKMHNLRDVVPWHLKRSFNNYKGSHPALPNISLTAQEAIRWKMASRASQIRIVRRCEDWPEIENIVYKAWVSLGFSMAASIYGGLHALAWSAHFDSSTEQLLWRISACVVIGGIPIMVVSCRLGESHETRFTNLFEDFYTLTWTGLVYLMLPAYVLARGYLVVECFINLSHLPAGVYDVPKWATYFPHIS